MAKQREKRPVGDWDGITIRPGESRDIKLAVSESYSGISLRIPIHVRRGAEEGPTVFVTAALHGDELNGTGAIRQLIQDPEFNLARGALILVPVLNLLAFDRHSRYLPDRRDLNRCFPGTSSGSLAGRMARTIFDEIVGRSDFGIDLHTASVRRTNYPNVRANMASRRVRRLAQAFGTDIILDNRGPESAFRREACKAGCPTIVMEGGEVWKVEPTIVETAVRGIQNVLCELGMVDGEVGEPDYQIVVEQSKWLRAEMGGFLQFHISPGDMVEKGQALTTHTTLLGHERSVLTAPFDGVVIGMTTLPAVSPGEPICHIGALPPGMNPTALHKQRVEYKGLEGRVVEELASNILVVDPRNDSTPDAGEGM